MENIALFPFWQSVRAKLMRNESCLVHAPQFYGKNSFMKYILNDNLLFADYSRIRIPSDYGDGKTIDYQILWNLLKKNKQINSRKKVKNESNFQEAFKEFVLLNTKKTLVIIPSVNRQSIARHFETINMFHGILSSMPRESLNKYIILVLDDYLLYYYENYINQKNSNWDYFERFYYRNIRGDEYQALLSSISYLSPAQSDLTTFLLKKTGGHPGLINETLKTLKSNNISTFIPSEHEKFLDDILHKSPIIEELRRHVEEDALGLTTRAIEYSISNPPRDVSSPTVQTLIQLGIIHKIDSVDCKLCDGLIFEMIVSLKKSLEKTEPLGTVLPYFGPKKYEVDTLNPIEDDIVIIHISDIHMGEGFPFQFSNLETDENKFKLSIVGLLRDDLKKQNLIGKIDAILISGDFTKKGEMDEFLRARDLIANLSTQLEIELSKIAFVAGNHDVQWKPSALLSRNSLTGISRDYYYTFQELLNKSKGKLVNLIKIESRSKKYLLRVICMDSNLIENPSAAGLGFIGPEIFQEAKHLLTLDNDLTEKYSGITNVILTHHHVFPSTSVPPYAALAKKISVLVNSYELLNFANDNHVSLIMHGHEHQPSITVSNRWPYDNDGFSPITTICAGSLSAEESQLSPFSKNHYYVTFLRKNDIIVRSRALRINGTAFFAHSDIQIPVM